MRFRQAIEIMEADQGWEFDEDVNDHSSKWAILTLSKIASNLQEEKPKHVKVLLEDIIKDVTDGRRD